MIELRRSRFADAAAAREALALVLPMIEPALADRRVSGTGCLHLVVLDPAVGPGDAAFADAVLLEHSIAIERWDADYAAFAQAKAELAWRHGRDVHALQALQPQLLAAGDSLLWGGVCVGGIVVGCSGAQPWYDEVFATALAAALRAVAKERHAAALAAGRLAA